MTRAVVTGIDSFGLGAAPDAPRFGAVGADTAASMSIWRFTRRAC